MLAFQAASKTSPTTGTDPPAMSTPTVASIRSSGPYGTPSRAVSTTTYSERHPLTRSPATGRTPRAGRGRPETTCPGSGRCRLGRAPPVASVGPPLGRPTRAARRSARRTSPSGRRSWDESGSPDEYVPGSDGDESDWASDPTERVRASGLPCRRHDPPTRRDERAVARRAALRPRPHRSSAPSPVCGGDRRHGYASGEMAA